MTNPELEALRTELIQTAAVIVSALEDIDFGTAQTVHSYRDEDGVYQAVGQTAIILQEVRKERVRQDEKWGPQHHRMADWLAIIGEEYGEACMAYVDDLLMPNILGQKSIGLGPRKKVRWGKAGHVEYGKPSTHIVTEQEALAHADQRIIEGYAPPLTFELGDDEHESEGRVDSQD
jgi:hypothetical protein